MIILLSGIDSLCLVLARSDNIVRTEVERPDYIDRYLAVKAKSLKTNRGDFTPVLIKSTNLLSTQSEGVGMTTVKRREPLTVCTFEAVIFRGSLEKDAERRKAFWSIFEQGARLFKLICKDVSNLALETGNPCLGSLALVSGNGRISGLHTYKLKLK